MRHLDAGTEADPVKLGCVESSKTHPPLRIVHISDTHLRHNEHLDAIPPGDVLIHSGDFYKVNWSRYIFRERDFLQEVQDINEFFSKLPHKYKIFVSGNHELNFEREPLERVEKLMTKGIYLQDSYVVIEGVKIYGSPWNGLRHNSHARGFAVRYSHLGKHWKLIPTDTDILVTHTPPFGILDLGLTVSYFNRPVNCDLCTTQHINRMHSGCTYLLDTVLNTVRPKAHLFGHCHDQNGLMRKQGVVFSNAALPVKPSPKVLDFYLDSDKERITNTQPVCMAPPNTSGCTIS